MKRFLTSVFILMLLLIGVAHFISDAEIPFRFSIEELDRYHEQYVFSYIERRCKEEHLDIKLVHNLIRWESSWLFPNDNERIGNERVVSRSGAAGLMQVMVKTAREFMNDASITQEDLITNHILNIECGIRYLSYLKKLYRGNMEHALSAYNQGPTRFEQNLSLGKNPSLSYVKRVMRRTSL